MSARCRSAARLAAICLGLAATAGHCEPLDQLRQFLAQTSSASGDFVQHSATPAAAASGAARAVPADSRGSFEFQRPGRFRWVYRTPYEQIIVSDGASLFLYDKDLAQVTKRPLNGTLPASPASILFGSNDFGRDFEVASDGSAQGVEWILAKPKSKESVFERIRIGFAGGLPVAMELRDTFGQATQLRFDHLQRNPALPAKDFSFTPPAGVDVLEDR